jgi:hypothetical protein
MESYVTAMLSGLKLNSFSADDPGSNVLGVWIVKVAIVNIPTILTQNFLRSINFGAIKIL